MSTSFKQLIAGIFTVVAILAIYFGSYLPLKKAQMHIDAIFNLQSGKIRTVEELNKLFDPVLDFYSPIGQDEITQYYLGILINIINQQTDKQVIDVLIKQAEDRMALILKINKGFSFNQNLYTFGSIYKIAAINLRDEVYYQKAITTFKKGLEYSPNRYIFLKGLFDLYSVHGDSANAREIGEVISKYWPEHKNIKTQEY